MATTRTPTTAATPAPAPAKAPAAAVVKAAPAGSAKPKPAPTPNPYCGPLTKGGIKRTTHWATREYHQFLLSRAKTPFAWGSNDCCLFPADAIKSFTGVDLAAAFRGKYTDEAGAMAAIKSIAGGTTVADAAAWCAKQQKLTEYTHPLMAKRGDLVVLANGGTIIAGVVHLSGRHIVTVAQGGLVRLPIRKAQRAWAV